MAYIRPLANNHFRADVRMKGIVKNKTFPTQKLAKAWADIVNSVLKLFQIWNKHSYWHCLMLILIAWAVKNYLSSWKLICLQFVIQPS